MEIKYWSDIACPFCYVGSNRMKKAMKELGIFDNTKLTFKAYQLDPNAPQTTTESYLKHFTHGNPAMESQAKAQMEHIESIAHEDGLPMDIQKVIPTNTMDAHRLIKFAASKDDPALTQRVIDRFYQVYFSDGKSIADHDVLISAATEAELDRAEVEEVLNSDQYHQDVVNDEAEAHQSGIQGVPFFVINNKYGISGAQPYELFIKALKQVMKEEQQA